MNYWEFGDYLAIGAGAHGKISLPKENRVIRIQKTRSPEDYLRREGSYVSASKDIDIKEMSLEFMMNALRLSQGVDIRTYEGRTGLSVNQIEPVLRKLKEQKLIKNSREKICPTKKGHMFLNSTLEAFFEK